MLILLIFFKNNKYEQTHSEFPFKISRKLFIFSNKQIKQTH